MDNFILGDQDFHDKRSTAVLATPGTISGTINNFVRFLAGLEVNAGLTVFAFLNNYGFFQSFAGAEMTGGVKIDEATITGNVNMALTSILLFGPDATEGTYRLRVVSGELLIEQYVSSVWVERGAFRAP